VFGFDFPITAITRDQGDVGDISSFPPGEYSFPSSGDG